MTRPLRLEFPGALFHITSRGNERRDIVLDDKDRTHFLQIFGEVVVRFRWKLYQYVLMTNHYHFVIALEQESLAEGMQYLNSVYAQTFNRRHGRIGHLFQGRYDSRLVQEEGYLQQVVRYDALNPVRAGLVQLPEEYPWSGHRAIAGLCEPPAWFDISRTRRCYAPDPVIGREYYCRFVDEGIGVERSPWKDLVVGIYLGDSDWVESLRRKIESNPRCDDFPIEQRNPRTTTMSDVINAVAKALGVDENMVRFDHGGMARMLSAWVAWYGPRVRLRSIAAALRVRSTSGISRMVRECEGRLAEDASLRAIADQCLTDLLCV